MEWYDSNRYKNLESLDNGVFGLTCLAFDNVTRQSVAIKKFRNPFDTIEYAKRTYREIALLKHVSHENIVELLDIYTSPTLPSGFKDIYMVKNFMPITLKEAIQDNSIKREHVKVLLYQILRGLKYLHSCGIIHRNLMPSNILINETCELRITGFGLAKNEHTIMTGYITTRYYRAPEVILNYRHYTKAIDVWSLGCILTEMYQYKPLFTGSTFVDQIDQIISLVGFPDNEILNQMNKTAHEYLLNRFKDDKPNHGDFCKYFKSHNFEDDEIDLLDKMFNLNPKQRITCEQALEHKFVGIYHDPEDEPNGIKFEDKFLNEHHTIEEWKSIHVFISNYLHDLNLVLLI